MISNSVLKLKSSLADCIEKWLEDNSEEDGYSELNTYVSNSISVLMADASFAVLLAQSDLSDYYRSNDMLNEQ